MDTNLNFVFLEELRESGENSVAARIVVVRGSLDAGSIPQEDWIRLDTIE
ncbi:MAG TPA: hypothetical protein VK525_01215 [Candidatus Saccharimonadales bacterium]|nr:hypothetical protein [Candidatus Saccharimonadales bacterium]